MTNGTEPNAADRLASLEDAAIAGQPITALQLAEAREQVALDELLERGNAIRTMARQQKEKAALRLAAKAQVAKLFQAHENDCLIAYDAAVASVNALIETIDAGNARLADAARVLRQAEVPVRFWNGTYEEGIDLENFAALEQGGGASSVISGGIGHGRETAALWVAAAVRTAARAHGGLPRPYGNGKLEDILRSDLPRALKVRTA